MSIHQNRNYSKLAMLLRQIHLMGIGALVLTTRGKTDKFDPMCHIGITTTVFRYDYSFEELDIDNFEILEVDQEIRAAPYTYVPLRRSTCIGIYTRKIKPFVNIIGNIDVSNIGPVPLTFDVGNGANGGWPLCGPVSNKLGTEAVSAWRSVYDREQFRKDKTAACKSNEELLVKIKEERRRKRKRGRANENDIG